MKFLVVLSCMFACSMAQLLVYKALPYSFPHHYGAPVVTSPVLGSLSSQFHAQDELGQFTFATAGDNQARTEVSTLGGVRGAYSYVDANGKLINVHYLADDQGFRVIGANNLPEAPAVPQTPELRGPEPVQDTPEVLAARAEFQKRYEEAASAAAAAPDSDPQGENSGSAVTVSRKKRGVLVPAVSRATVRYHQFEPVDANVPADTNKIELKEREHEVLVPSVAYSYPYPAVHTTHAGLIFG